MPGIRQIELNEHRIENAAQKLPKLNHGFHDVNELLALIEKAKGEGTESLATLLMAAVINYDDNFLVLMANIINQTKKDEYSRHFRRVAQAVIDAKNTKSRVMSIFDES